MSLRHIQTVHSKGKVYRYLRLPGQPRHKLPDLPLDHPDFLLAYAQALNAVPKMIRAPAGSIAAMAEAFLRSERFKANSETYRQGIRRHVDAIREQAEDALAGHLRTEHIRADLAALPPHPAGARLRAWRQLCAFGVAKQMLKTDPSDGIKRPAAPKSEGHLPWSDEELAAFRARWPIGSVPRACFELLFWTGARISDAVKVGPRMVGRDGVLAFKQTKTGDETFVPWTCAVPDYAEAMKCDRDTMHRALECLAGAATFLPSHGGRVRSHKALGTLMIESAKAAGISGKSAHGLRKARAVALANAGATTHQIAAWTGHQTLSEVEHYTAAANRRRAVIGGNKG